MIKALIFDFDGVIVDTETPSMEAWKRIYIEHGHVLPHEKWVQYFLYDSFDPLLHLRNLCGSEFDASAANSRRNTLKSELCDIEPVRTGVTDWLQQARAANLLTAIASGSRSPWITHHLAARDLTHLFDAVCTREEIENPKPAPDLFLLAAHRLGVQPSEALVIEDSPNGLKAAQAAGMPCVVVTNPLTEALTFDPHGWHLASLSSVSLTDVLTQLERKQVA